MTSMFEGMMSMMAGGDKPKVQQPQVAVYADQPHETGRTLPQSDAENAAILDAEEDERSRQRKKSGQQSTILTGSLDTQEDTSQRKTLLGA